MGEPAKELFDINMPVGEGHRYQHDCSNKVDKCLIITRTRQGWIWYCHRCKEHGMKDLSGRSIKERMEFIKSLNVQSVQEMRQIRLPLDYTREIPMEGYTYLYTRGLLDSDIKRYRIGYSQRYNRLIFPVYEKRNLVFFEGRTLGYVTKENPKWMKVFKPNKKNVRFYVENLFSSDVAVVEDIISAIRVGHILDACAVISTHVQEDLIYDLDNKYRTLYLWLDPDKRSKCIKLVSKYRMHDIDIRLVKSDKDPKYYSNEEIRRLIYE